MNFRGSLYCVRVRILFENQGSAWTLNGDNAPPPVLLSVYWTWYTVGVQYFPRYLQPDDTEQEGIILLVQVLRWLHGTVGEDVAFVAI